ncbi:MAG: hypothetical protein QXZ17_14400 [Nitrososphaerota archaeon]
MRSKNPEITVQNAKSTHLECLVLNREMLINSIRTKKVISQNRAFIAGGKFRKLESDTLLRDEKAAEYTPIEYRFAMTTVVNAPIIARESIIAVFIFPFVSSNKMKGATKKT